jgi:phosphoglycerate dehydrogenase-like enzyme
MLPASAIPNTREQTMPKINVLVTVPQPLRGLILTPEAERRLRGFADVTMNDSGGSWTAEEIAERLPGVDALVTSWGIVTLDEQVLSRADRLKIVAHSAGSVKRLVTDALYDRGIVVTHAAGRIADSVAEFTLLCVMMGLRRPQDMDRQMKAGGWPKTREAPVYEIAGRRVGILGMGYVGRRSARLFQAVGAEVWVYDPYLPAEDAERLGVVKAELDTVLAECPVISIHLPVTDETLRMIGPRELGLIQDGAVFVNTARSLVVDQDALLAELQKGRFWAALDVFDQEPLPTDHPYRSLDNVLLTPHVAGLTMDSYRGLMALAIDEIERFFSGQPLVYPVTREMLATMA